MIISRNCRCDSFASGQRIIVNKKQFLILAPLFSLLAYHHHCFPPETLHSCFSGYLWQTARTYPSPLVEMSRESTYWWRSAILFCCFCLGSPVVPCNLAIINKVTKPQRKCGDMFLTSLPARQARGRPLQPTESGNLRAANWRLYFDQWNIL